MNQDAPQSGFLVSILPLVLLFAIFYFLIIRPQQKQTKNHKQMIVDLSKGDDIITNGGFIVKIEKVEDDFFKVRLNDDTVVRLSKNFISSKIDKEKS
jgi:preprotein translocase subunit YajC